MLRLLLESVRARMDGWAAKKREDRIRRARANANTLFIDPLEERRLLAIVTLEGPDLVAGESPLNSGLIRLLRDVADGNPLSVTLGFSGSANPPPGSPPNPADWNTYVGGFLVPGPTYDIPANQMTLDIEVRPEADGVPEPQETAIFTIQSVPAGHTIGSPSQQTVTIDDAVLPALSIGDVQVTEGNSGGVDANFQVTLSEASASTVTVVYTTSNGTATSPDDYLAVIGAMLTFLPGQVSKTATITVVGDVLGEPNETFTVNLSSPAGATIADGQGVGTILDDEPIVSIVSNDPNAAETGPDPGTFTISRTGSTTSTLLVDVSVATGPGQAQGGGIDYTSSVGGSIPAQIQIDAGQSSKTFSIDPLDDLVVEGPETVQVSLPGAPGTKPYTVGNPSSATVTIADNDLPEVTITATDALAFEKGSDDGEFRVSLSAAIPYDLTVSYSISVGEGFAESPADFTLKTPSGTPLTGQVTIAAGQSSALMKVDPVDDKKPEIVEAVLVQLTTSSTYVLGSPSAATVLILDTLAPQTNANDDPHESCSGLCGEAELDGRNVVLVPLGDGFFLIYVSTKNPHPIITVESTVNDLAGGAYPTTFDVELRLFKHDGTPVSSGARTYTAAGLSASNNKVRFAQQVDASSFTTGRYKWTMVVTSRFQDGSSQVTEYTGDESIVNRSDDLGPYGKGFYLGGADRVYDQTAGTFTPGGVTLVKGDGTALWFARKLDGTFEPAKGDAEHYVLTKVGSEYFLKDKAGTQSSNSRDCGFRLESARFWWTVSQTDDWTPVSVGVCTETAPLLCEWKRRGHYSFGSQGAQRPLGRRPD